MKAAYLLMLGDAWGTAMASLQNSFGGLRQHADLLLEWEPAGATDYPLVLHVRVFNATSDHTVNTFETDIATGLYRDSFMWNDLPSPLPFLPSATYQLQIGRQLPAGDIMSDFVITSSSPFSILPESEDENDDSRVWPTTTGASESANSETSQHPDSSTAIAAGLVVPFVVGISVFVFICMQRRRKRTLEERRKERQTLVID
ncbi:hypothetical protein F5B22DRAFT_331792 [Xylaria bambusicola]|uniref:uncharacterized protein n=1 Tax=Xylaria bambusicola TaxID=326684 RepID=UPI0020085AA9|nr:uncharacterized protein F5B22DRAFT_331792 [Xylaria bambusicola]KAI0509452.1 hypothetical protein F5B22DRAFT_331792 [Xylaria bambusicola]